MIPGILILALQITAALLITYWAFYTLVILGMILLKTQPPTNRAAIATCIRELPFAIALSIVLIVGTAYHEARS